MPELPEVETLRRDLVRQVIGRRLVAVQVSGARTVRRQPPGVSFASRLEGRTILGVGRRGKYLLVQLDGGDAWVVHLGMSGQLLLAQEAGEPLRAHTHLLAAFADGAELRFVDPRTFGETWVSQLVQGSVPELAHLGFEPLDPQSASVMGRGLSRTQRQLKGLLLDQRFVAGIGNIYSDEILHVAGLRWDRPASSLAPTEVLRLHREMVGVLNAAIDARGSSLADSGYRDLNGKVGGFQAAHRVYAREGQPCGTCGDPIVRLRLSGRSSFFCPRCQA